MRFWPTAYPKKCTREDVRFFMLLCLGQEPRHQADIDIHIGTSPFGFCKSLLSSGIFARSILAPLHLGKKIAPQPYTADQIATVIKGLKRHFHVPTTSTASVTSWVTALGAAVESSRFLKAFDAAATSFPAGWLQQNLREAQKTAPSAINAHISHLSAHSVNGYAYDAHDPTKALVLAFYLNDTFIGTSHTNSSSDSSLSATSENGYGEFSHKVSVPAKMSGQKRLYLSVYETETDTLVCPAMEFPRVDIRHTLLVEQLSCKLDKIAAQVVDNDATVQQLMHIRKALPDIEQFAALPVREYGHYKECYQTPTPPPAAAGMLPNVSIAKAPDYTYDPKADVVLFLEEGARLSPCALEWVQHAAATAPDAALFYSDYDTTSSDGTLVPHYRTAFDKDLFYEAPPSAAAYAVRRDKLEEVGGLDTSEDAPHYALWLRLLERHSETSFHHLPHVLWHIVQQQEGRTDATDTLNEHLKRLDSAAITSHHQDKYAGAVGGAVKISWPIDDDFPKLAIIIPTRDAVDLTRNCIESLRNTLEHPDHTEIIIVDNGSVEIATKDWLKWVDGMDGIRVLLHDAPFNWSEINNKAVENSDADYFLFLNNDTVALDHGWDHILRGYLNRDDVGLVGARLLFADGTIQFGGYIVNEENIALKEAYGESPDEGGYQYRSQLTHRCTALIGAFMACRRDVYDQAGGFDAENFPVAFNDIDFSLTVDKHGYKNLYVPAITFHHLESKSRGYDAHDAQKAARENNERNLMRGKWGAVLESDPWYPSAFVKREPTHSLLAAPKKASITTES